MLFSEPETVDEAIRLLAADPEARCLAGGATLVAMMNAGLVEPTRLISLRRVAGLDGIEPRKDGSVRIGAMTRHATVAGHDGFAGSQAILRAAARRIGHPAIRNMGTIGGSICHADPSADYPTAITAADAIVEVRGPAGARHIPASAFFLDWLETALEEGEIVTGVIVPADPDGMAVHYEKFARADGDFATVAVAACVAVEDGLCRALRVAVGGVAEKPVRSPEAESTLNGRPIDDAALAALGEALVEFCNPLDDMRGSAAYRLKLVPRLVARAVRRAAASGEGGSR